MKKEQTNQVVYKRDKNKVEITGNSKDTKWPIWFDLVSSRLAILLVLITVLQACPTNQVLLMLIKFLKRFLILMIYLPTYIECITLLSG